MTFVTSAWLFIACAYALAACLISALFLFEGISELAKECRELEYELETNEIDFKHNEIFKP